MAKLNYRVAAAAVILAAAVSAVPAEAQPKPRRPEAAAPAGQSSRDVLDQAAAALKANDDARAVKLYEQARTMRDFVPARTTPALVMTAGDYYASLGTPESLDLALTTYAEVMNHPVGGTVDRGVARVKRAEILLRQDKPQAAKDEVQTLRASGSRRTLVLADLGDAAVALHLGQAEVARDKLVPLLESDEPVVRAMALFSLGRAYVQLKQTDQAVASFRRLWNQYGETPYVKRAVFLVGGIYLDRGDFMEARKLFEACAVIGAPMQSRVQGGDELVIKVSDANYFARTRSHRMNVTVWAPSGDKEVVALEKNPVSDVLYTGRVATALSAAAPAPNDATLQVRGSDVIEMAYEGQVAPPRKVLVVDDGRINIDATPLPDPGPRKPASASAAAVGGARTKGGGGGDRGGAAPAKPVIAAARQDGGAVNPGSPVYVQVTDADLDTTDGPDTVKAQVLAQGARGGSGAGEPVSITLTETGPHTGVFAGMVNTAAPTAGVFASSESTGHPASDAGDADVSSPAPGAALPAAKPGAHATYWKGLAGEKSHWIEIDLRQPAFLGKLTWGTGTDPLAVKGTPIEMTVTARGDNTERTVEVKGNKPMPTGSVVDLGGVFARYVRIEITKFDGVSPAIGQLILTDDKGAQLLPTGIAQDAAAKKGVLEFDVGQTVSAKYTDEENVAPGLPTVRESRRLGASYHDATLSVATKAANTEATYSPMYRLDLKAEPFVTIGDPDADTTPQPDKLTLAVFTESGVRRTLNLTETGPSTGTFAAALPVTTNEAAREDERFLHVKPGELVWMTHMDERNMRPGYRTFRHAWILENRPTAGELAPIGLLHTAWPFEIKGEEEALSAAGNLLGPERPGNAGRVSFTLIDPDALSRAGQSVGIKASALLSGAARELSFSSSSSGEASKSLDLVLGDKDAGEATAGDLSVSGDEVLRLAYKDEQIPTADLRTRAVYSEDEIKSKLAAPAPAAVANPAEAGTPTIKLRDPQRRLAAEQAKHLTELRTELGRRVASYNDDAKALTARRDLLNKRLAEIAAATKAKPGTTANSGAAVDAAASGDEALKAAVTALDTQATLLTQRSARLTAMGATAPPPAPAAVPAAVDAAPAAAGVAVEDQPLMPGQPFVVTVDDADLTAAEIDVRLRSVAGRMVDSMVVKATRDATGLYTARVNTERSTDAGSPNLLSLAPGGEVLADYTDAVQAAPAATERVTYVALASDATLLAVNPGFSAAIADVRLGEAVHVQVTDFDQDRSAAQDRVIVTVSSPQGDSLQLVCTETEPHSGVFRASFLTDRGAANLADDVLQGDYGGEITLAYADGLRTSPGSAVVKTLKLPIGGGADGVVLGFTRQFRDAREEMKLWYRTGQAAYEMGRKLYLGRSIERAEENFAEATDYFQQLVRRFPDDPLAATANYYLGNIQALKGHHREALERFNEVVTRWPKTDYVARARFKIGQSHEALGQFDQAADAYVLLTYHHPADEQVPTAMIRMMNHYARQEAWPDAVAIADRFIAKFPEHEQAGAVALKGGQWLAVSEKTNDALAWFARQEKVFATNDKAMPGLLYWHAATLLSNGRGGGGGRGAKGDKVKELLNRVVYDYPSNEYVPMAKIAIEQLQQRN
ncbi:MAG: tetratricopeptide repeat protein [Phycisphaerae bacterium]|nr:tetratricopeptide repeat protein [Tepidisphaeraceae bacterium]